VIRLVRVSGAVAFAALLSACAGWPAAQVAKPAAEAVTPAPVAPAAAAGAVFDPERSVLTMAPLVERVTPAVVNTAVRSRVQVQANPLFEDPFFRRFFDLPEQPPQRDALSAGSGVIVDAGRGYVLTNHHVIADAQEIQVTLKDRRTYAARLIGDDPETDIALVEINAPNLSAVAFGDSDRLEVGDVVIAIGNPVRSRPGGDLGHRQRARPRWSRHRRLRGLHPDRRLDQSRQLGRRAGQLEGELVGINTAILGPTGATSALALPCRSTWRAR
jgi:serine protease DegQ